MNLNKKKCLYHVLGKCARNDEGIGIQDCKKICEFYLCYEMIENRKDDRGFNGMKEEDFDR